MADRLALTVARSSSAHCQAQQRNFDSISPCLKLNEDACLNLDVIIGSFSAPITEEHAWAIVFEAVKCLENLVKNQNFSSTSNNSSEVIGVKQGEDSTSVQNKVLNESEPLKNRVISDKNVNRRHKKRIHLVTKPSDVWLHRDGRVHEISFLDPQDSTEKIYDGMTDTATSRPTASSVEKAITELGVVIYNALDFGLKEAEERQLTPGLETLLDLMTSLDVDCSGNSSTNTNEQPRNHFRSASNSSTGSNGGVCWDDEGIEDDHEDELDSVDPRPLSPRSYENMNATFATASALKAIDHVLRLCENHLSDGSEAAAHYRNVCRALVSEALELSSFLEKAWLKKNGDDGDFRQELQELALRDWAHLWIQTMNDLRQGVKLKKTNYTKTPIEYALTPYEMLMDDIRSKRYKLNKVRNEDGQLPLKVKKDAHDLILDFIRSRPPLKPAMRRKLAPLRKYSTPQELLLMDISSENAKKNLRKTSGPVVPSKLSLPGWDSSKIFRPLHERQQEEEEEDIYHIVHKYPMQNSKGEIIVEQDELDYNSSMNLNAFGNSKDNTIVSVRRVSRHRKGANTFKHPHPSSKNPELNGRRPYSMSCLLATNSTSPYIFHNSNSSSNFPINEEDRLEDTPYGYNSPKTLIRPDPSFNFNPSSSDSDDDEDSVDRQQSPNFKHLQPHYPERLRGSESVACLPSSFQSHSDPKWRESNRNDPILSTPNNLRRHTLGQQHLLNHQKQLLQSQQNLSGRRNRSRESLDNERKEVGSGSASNQKGYKQFNSTSAIPQNGYNPSARGTLFYSPYNPSQNSRAIRSTCHSSTPKMSNNVDSTEQSVLFSSDEVSPVVLRDKSRSLRTNMEQLSEEKLPNVNGTHHQGDREEIWNGNVSSSHNSHIKSQSQPKSTLKSRGKNAQHEHSKGLNLSHDEVAHIRSVLAKAKLEALPLTQELRSDLERSRVCFQCMKVKFSLFSWAYACKLCRHSICSKCITKVNIPDDHFRNVPVGALSPSIEMQQKQQQNLLQRTTSVSNSSTPQSDSTTKQSKSSSFWNHFGIGGSKQEDTSSNNAINATAIPGTPHIAMHDDPGCQMNGDTNGLNEINSGMAPRVRLRRSNTITSRVPGLPHQNMPSSDQSFGMPRYKRGEESYSTQKELENSQKLGWTSKFNSMGSNSSSTLPVGNSTSSANATSQINICLECKDVVDNIGRKNNVVNGIHTMETRGQDQNVILRTPKSSNHPHARDIRNMHTQSMIIE